MWIELSVWKLQMQSFPSRHNYGIRREVWVEKLARDELSLSNEGFYTLRVSKVSASVLSWSTPFFPPFVLIATGLSDPVESSHNCMLCLFLSIRGLKLSGKWVPLTFNLFHIKDPVLITGSLLQPYSGHLDFRLEYLLSSCTTEDA